MEEYKEMSVYWPSGQGEGTMERALFRFYVDHYRTPNGDMISPFYVDKNHAILSDRIYRRYKGLPILDMPNKYKFHIFFNKLLCKEVVEWVIFF